jgi:hypothetical protein
MHAWILHKLLYEIRNQFPNVLELVTAFIYKLLTCSVYLQIQSIFNVPSMLKIDFVCK